MSSDNPGKNPGHRKSKVSYATLIDVGLVGPKAKPKGDVDGQQVKIPAPLNFRFKVSGGRGELDEACLLDMVCVFLQASCGVKNVVVFELRGMRTLRNSFGTSLTLNRQEKPRNKETSDRTANRHRWTRVNALR